MFSEFDKQMMTKAIALAKQGLYSTKPNPTVGCIICKDSQVIAEGWHRRAGEPHAEQFAIREANEKGVSLLGATAYVTLEPCSHIGKTPSCADALAGVGVSKVVVAMQDPNPLVSGKGIKKLLANAIDVKVGLMAQEAEQLNKGFIHSMKNNIPFVRLKIASSLDGRTAMANNQSKWITGEEARVEVHKMRAKHGAIITGIGTILADNPSLNVRLSDEQLTEMNLTTETCQPIRVVLDANLSVPIDSKMFSSVAKTIIMTSKETTETSQDIINQLYQKNVEIVAVATDGDKLDIESVLAYLSKVENINDVMVEAGAVVAGAFIQSGFVQEVHVFMAPILMGDKAKPMFVLDGLNTMDDKINFEYSNIAMSGKDIHFTLIPKA